MIKTSYVAGKSISCQKKVDVGGKSISCQQKKLMLDKKGISFRQKQDEVAQENIFQKSY